MPSRDRGLAALLRSQGLGLVCGFGTAALLAIGSFVIVWTRDGASRAIGGDDLRAFVEHPSWVHWWFYLLVPVVGLYVLNTVLATWHATVVKLRAGVKALSHHAPAVFHVAFLVALLAHLVGGFGGADLGREELAQGVWTALPGGREARLVSLAPEFLPNGMPRQANAIVEVREPDGSIVTDPVDYNVPISRGFGAELHLLAQAGDARVVRLTLGEATCEAVEGAICRLPGLDLEVRRIMQMPSSPMPFVGLVTVAPGAEKLWIGRGRVAKLADGRPVGFEALEDRPSITLHSRRSPGNPWALASAVLLAIGVALIWRRILHRPVHAPAAE